MQISKKIDTDNEIIMSAVTDAGSTLTADCNRVDQCVAQSVLADLHSASPRDNWLLEIRGETLQISCDRDPTYGYVMSMSALGKGYGGKKIRRIGQELVDRIEAGVNG